MNHSDELRVMNPFSDPLVTELIENPALYQDMFSETILVGETLAMYRPHNVCLVGPQGSGKSMLLNLIRYQVMAQYLATSGRPPRFLQSIQPFFGISINLARANFHTFG